MQEVRLPLMSGDDTVADALAALNATPLSAMVLDVAPTSRVLFVSDLDSAHEAGVTLLRDVPGYESLPPPAFAPGAAVADYAVGTSAGWISPTFGDIDWQASGADYVGVLLDAEASIVTRHETYADRLFRRLACEATPPHRFPRPPKSAGDQCPRCTGTSVLSYR